MKINFDRILSQVNDYHIVVSVFVFMTGSVLSWFHRLDGTFVAFTATVLSAVTGHAYIKSKNGGDDSAMPPPPPPPPPDAGAVVPTPPTGSSSGS